MVSSSSTPSLSSTSASSSTTASMGRERALEVLMDRDPLGSYYRAARVVEDVVPNALASRPNLVTRSALVDQALSLSKYDVDRLSKYDSTYENEQVDISSNKAAAASPVDSLTKERILHHHVHMLQDANSSEANVDDDEDEEVGVPFSTPFSKDEDKKKKKKSKKSVNSKESTAALVSALRRLFGGADSKSTKADTTTAAASTVSGTTTGGTYSSLELRQLLEAVTGHAVLQQQQQQQQQQQEPREETTTSAGVVDHYKQHMESIVLHLCQDRKTGLFQQQQDTSDFLQGLLLAVLSLLTPPEASEPEDKELAPTNPKSLLKQQKQDDEAAAAKAAAASTTRTTASGGGDKDDAAAAASSSDEPDEPRPAILLQVASLLHLLPLPMPDSAAARTGDEGADNGRGSSLYLDPEWLSYFGAAAAVAQERQEIKQARLLQQQKAKPSVALDTKDSKDKSGEKAEGDEDKKKKNGPGDSASGSGTNREGGAVDVQEIDDEDDEPDDDEVVGGGGLANINAVPEEALQEAFEQFVSTMAQAAVSDAPLESLEQFVSSMARGEDVPLDDDEDDDDDDEDDEDDDEDDDDDGQSSTESYPQLVSRGQSGNSGDSGSSSSSGSDSSEFSSEEDEDDDDEPNVLESDRGLDTDEDDEDAMLRQALAMSEQEEASQQPDTTENTNNPYVFTQGSGVSSDTITDDGQEEEETPAPETPVSSSRDVDSVSEQVEGKPNDDEEEEEDEESNLPPFPSPPDRYPFLSLLGASRRVAVTGNDVEDPDETGNPAAAFFDPSALTQFGALPTSRVLMHLLRYASKIVEQRRFTPGPKTDEPISSVPGGMGAALFPKQQPQPPKYKQAPAAEIKTDGLTLQLLAACYLLLDEKRSDAVESLRKALAREQRFVHAQAGGGEMAATDDESPLNQTEDLSEAPPPSGGEEDDPAMALAMNYVEDDVPLSSESLENKGMRRKAAAAAYDAAALVKSLKRQTDEWKDSVKLYSHCLVQSLRLLRLFLQSFVRRLLVVEDAGGNSSSSSSGVGGGFSLLDRHHFFPRAVAEKLLTSMSSLMSQNSRSVLTALLSEDDAESCLLSLSLFKEAVNTWGECIPLAHPASEALSAALKRQLAACVVAAGQDTPFPSLETLSVFPSSKTQVELQKLQSLCRRLRVCDLLDGFVAKPVPYLEQGEDEIPSRGYAESLSGSASLAGSGVISMLGKALKSLNLPGSEAERLFLALCHRCHSRVLLLDGFYATTKTETDEASSSTFSSKAASSSDIIRVSASPSPSLQFDSTKCADSIAILADSAGGSSSNGPSVHQRASKVWGTVLSTCQISPKTGLHRWAVRLDKCERGHVFIGVATAQGSVRTYVGGDKYGWGMIGTQALWHDRRKIRGDYGSTLRSGATVIVTLDSDAGTLSLGLWKDSSSTSSLSVDPLVQSAASPKKQGFVAGTLEDWGTAFEGLPLDSRLYPAIGLYQRDDRVTLLNVVESAGRVSGLGEGGQITAGECFYPREMDPSSEKLTIRSIVPQIRSHNDSLNWDSVKYTAETLKRAADVLDESADNSCLVTILLPSLAASLCLLPSSVPILSTRSALVLMPHVRQCIDNLGSYIEKLEAAPSLFQGGITEGKWTIRATGTAGSSADFEEYVVDIKRVPRQNNVAVGFEGHGVGTVGKSKNGIVSVVGTSNASSLTFAEEWSEGGDEGKVRSKGDASSCVITARISLDGRRFDGTYRNVQYGSSGQIVGVLPDETSLNSNIEDASGERIDEMQRAAVVCQALLYGAHSHLAAIVGDAVDLISTDAVDKNRRGSLQDILDIPLLSSADVGLDSTSIQDIVVSLKSHYLAPDSPDTLQGIRCDQLLAPTAFLEEKIAEMNPCVGISLPQAEEMVARADLALAPLAGGKGSLMGLCADPYTDTRRRLVLTLLYLTGLQPELAKLEPFESLPVEGPPVPRMMTVWRTALRIIEDGIRAAIAQPQAGKKKRDQALDLCSRYNDTSNFFLGVGRRNGASLSQDDFGDVLDGISTAYEAIKGDRDLAYLESEMLISSKRAVLRSLSLQEISSFLSSCQAGGATALESVSLVLPHLLGRGRSTAKPTGCPGSIPNLDGEYLSALPGGSPRVKQNLKLKVKSLFEKLGRILSDAIAMVEKTATSESQHESQSVILAVLPLFASQVRSEDFDEFISSSVVLRALPQVLSFYRNSMLVDIAEAPEETTVESALDILYAANQRDASLSILTCASSVAHALLYQAAAYSSAGHNLDSIPGSVALLLEELTVTFSAVERNALTRLGYVVKHRTDEDLKRWHESGKDTALPKSSKSSGRVRGTGFSGIEYLRLFGANAKPSMLRMAQSGIRSVGLTSIFGTASLHDLLSQWLHVVCVIFRSPGFLRLIASDGRWLVGLLKVIGLMAGEDDTDGNISSISLRSHADGILPARFRSRVIRLMLPLLRASPPNKCVVEGLYELAGVTSSIVTRSVDHDESSISTECVSLLRNLHSPSNPNWRACVNAVIDSLSGGFHMDRKLTCKKVGVLTFFSGSIGGIDRGSFVLLKPANASALSSEQVATSPKSHSSGISGSSGSSGGGASPHHLVGNGTDSVVAGLCSHESSAGILSSIDTKNGLCEVILLPRNQEPDSGMGSFESVEMGQARKRLVGKQSLTVRALRTPLADTMLAQEVPLIVDETVPVRAIVGDLLNKSLSTLLSAAAPETEATEVQDFGGAEEKSLEAVHGKAEEASDSVVSESKKGPEDGDGVDKAPSERKGETVDGDEKPQSQGGVRAGVLGMASDVLVVRCCVVALSNRRILQTFMKDEKSRTTLSRLLALAWPEPPEAAGNLDLIQVARDKPLSYLSLHESRFGHLVGLMRDVSSRLQIVSRASGADWKSRLDELFPEGTSVTVKSAGDSEPPEQPLQSQDTPSAPKTTSDSGHRREATQEGSENRSSSFRRSVSQSTGGSNSDEDDESEAAATAAAHLREAAIAQMAELGLPRSWSELALRRVGGLNIEAAVTFCLECGGEMERLLAEERERERARESGGSSSGRQGHRDNSPSNQLLRQLMEMGFPRRWCVEALAVTGNNVDEALTWILSNGERLSEEDEAIEAEDDGAVDDGDDDDSGDDDEDDDEETDRPVDEELGLGEGVDALKSGAINDDTKGWTGSITPLRFISGRSIINPDKLEVSGLPNGGFSSVGTKGVLLTTGKWYYEAILKTAGCLQIGWADGSFSGHCHADRGDGCGDGPSSWAFDGWRRYRWHSTATEWGCRWKEGDVVGCLVDMDARTVSFTLNGEGESIGMGVAFSGEGFRPCGGVYVCVSFNRKEKLRLILGGSGSEPFKYKPPDGYRGVGEAVLQAVSERDAIIEKERILHSASDAVGDDARPFLCDFSDGEHGHELMAWGHRYYGSDASVHLGSGGSKHAGTSSSKGVSSSEATASAYVYVNRRLGKVWSSLKEPSDAGDTSLDIRNSLKAGYEEVEKDVAFELFNECLVVSILLARKLIIHSCVGMGTEFDPRYFCSGPNSMRKFGRVFDACSSLRSAGWAGEAGAMAIAAEALGLGISSNEHLLHRSLGDWSGLVPAPDLDSSLVLPVAGCSQLLDAVTTRKVHSADEPEYRLLSGAEVALCGGGGGCATSFLQESLQSGVTRSEELRQVLIASVRRSVRLLAVVEYEGDDGNQKSVSEDGDEESDTGLPGRKDAETRKRGTLADHDQPDARLAAFLSGLLLSKSSEDSVDDFVQLQASLAESWSVGLLSASIPWRMICAFTVAGIIRANPTALLSILDNSATVARFFGRLPSTVARRAWAERAAVPVCSRYVQAMTELLAAVKLAVKELCDLPDDFIKYWRSFQVDAATPLPLDSRLAPPYRPSVSWQADEGWVSSDSDWFVWTGHVEYERVKWKTPVRSTVPALMDSGDGPPLLDIGCTVIRAGSDWDDEGSGAKSPNEDGKDLYDAEKSRRGQEKRKGKKTAKDSEEETPGESSPCEGQDQTASAEDTTVKTTENPAEPGEPDVSPEAGEPKEPAGNDSEPEPATEKVRKKLPSPKLPIGTVIAIEPWNGVPAMGRRVRWHLTGVEGVYRFGGDGGRFDICHVETNKKGTRIKKRHPVPESAEQCASRHGFGRKKKFPVLLRLRDTPGCPDQESSSEHRSVGILEWPDFGAGVLVSCTMKSDGSVTLREEKLLFGSKDSGWDIRFGQPSFVSGSEFVLLPRNLQTESDTMASFSFTYQDMLASHTFDVTALRNPANGDKLKIFSKMKLCRGKEVRAAMPPPFSFDSEYHAPSMSLSRDGRTVSCVASEGRGTAFASVGFTKGVHYWEIKIEQADIGSVFIGVAEKPNGSGSGSSFGFDTPLRLNRWHGWGFVNFRATYTSGAERVYGAHCHAGDTVGVLLDCDAGRVAFFFDGLKYGEHILNDLGCAFEHLSPFGFNVDGCGSGGPGQGAPNGFDGGRSGRYPSQGTVRPRALFPVVGLRSQGDRATISPKWSTSYGVDSIHCVRNILKADEAMSMYSQPLIEKERFPQWLLDEAFSEYQNWSNATSLRRSTRGSGPYRMASYGLDLELNSSPRSCAAASASIGLDQALLSGDRVRLLRSAGRILELAEEAVVLGTYGGRLYYCIVSQKSEGGSLTEGGGRAWCLDESEVVSGLPFVRPGKGLGVPLPKLERFKCPSSGGLKIVHEGGAILRSDIEIYDGSMILGTIPADTELAQEQVLERRVNSCGVVRYRVAHEEYGEGWISARIREGKEEPIVEPVVSEGESELDSVSPSYKTPDECAAVWFEEWKATKGTDQNAGDFHIESLDVFEKLLSEGVIPGLTVVESDSTVVAAVSAVSNHTEGGDSLECGFNEVVSALSSVLPCAKLSETTEPPDGVPACRQAAANVLSRFDSSKLPDLQAVMARIALLRAFNRRTRLALPWLSLRPCQEGSAVLGGLSGHGTSVDRAGRSRLVQPENSWVQVPSIASTIRSIRGLFFTSVKREFLQSVTEATTTPTPLSHDEYELPREIRTVRINRLKAGRAMMSDDSNAKRKHSVFAQLHAETKSWGGAALRRGFVAKGHGGQKRAFKVKLIGEGVNDYSGPYREVFTDAVAEAMKTDSDGRVALGVLDPTPNNSSGIGEDRDLFMFSMNGRDLAPSLDVATADMTKLLANIRRSFGSLTLPRDEASREVEESLVFLGRIVGTAYRHGISVDLPLPLESVWKALTEEASTSTDQLAELDCLANRQLANGSQAHDSSLLLWQQRMLNSFTEGLGNVLPVEILPIMTGKELRETVCGNPEVDVDMLRRVVEYEGYDESKDEVIRYFWNTLREMTHDERKQFLQFVWARNRLPLRESDFEAPFKIQKDTVNEGDKADQVLPSASTCFFSLTLPNYSSQATLRQKLLFAIMNVTTMETDFQTNSAEIAEGYRAF